MKRIEFEGKVHEFPDDFTDADISKALGGNTPATQPTAPPAQAGGGLLNYILYGGPRSSGKMEPDTGSLGDYIPHPPRPSATTLATMSIPGTGLIPALARIGTSAVGRGGGAAMAGEDPAQAALHGGLWQAAGEAAAPIAAPVLRGAGRVAGTIADYIPGLGSVRALTRAAESLAASQRAATQPMPAVHQANNFANPVTLYGPSGQVVSNTTAPIVFNRVVPGGNATIHGGGGSMVSPTQVTVSPPSGGNIITGGPSPAAILEERLTNAAAPRHWTGWTGALMRLLGTGGQESDAQSR